MRHFKVNLFVAQYHMPEMLTVEQAAASVMQSLSPLSRIKKPLEEALGYYLSQDIAAERDYPPFDRITMDGIAVHYAAIGAGKSSFPVEGYAAAGNPQSQLHNPKNAVEVATGAPLPEGCDTVIPYEYFELEGETAALYPNMKITKGDAIHPRGSDAKKGQILLKAGQAIAIPEMTVLAGNGVAQVPVYRKPSIGILATGNELVPMEAVIESHQIRRSNDITLKAALFLNGFCDVECGWVPDDETLISEALLHWIQEKDVVLITGGVSKGARDYVPGVLKRLGVQEIFHRVAQRPGKPLWYGRTDSALVFGLPGNPNSSLVCLTRYVLPALVTLSGGNPRQPHSMALAATVKAHDTLTVFMPVSIDGGGYAHPLVTQTSGDFTGLLGSDGFVALPPLTGRYQPGFRADYYPWRMP